MSLIIQLVVKLLCKGIPSLDRFQIQERLNLRGMLKILLLLACKSVSPLLCESRQECKARSLECIAGRGRVGSSPNYGGRCPLSTKQQLHLANCGRSKGNKYPECKNCSHFYKICSTREASKIERALRNSMGSLIRSCAREDSASLTSPLVSPLGFCSA